MPQTKAPALLKQPGAWSKLKGSPDMANDSITATISERGNGLPDAGDYVPGDDGELYEVVSVDNNIQTGRSPGEGNWIHAHVRLVDWSDCAEGSEFQALAIVAE